MAWPDWNNLSLLEPQNLPVLLVFAALVAVTAFALGRRHGRARYAALGLRLVALTALGVVLLVPVATVQNETRFEPQDEWRLALSGWILISRSGSREYTESPDRFVSRVREALANGRPPATVEVVGDREVAISTRDAVLALGVPCRASYDEENAREAKPIITSIRAPRVAQPGEPFTAEFAIAGTGATLHVTLDGAPLELTGNTVEIRSADPGRHVLEAVLLDAQGAELQRAGHVFRVGEWPRVLAIGLDDKQLTRARELAPDMRIEGVAPDAFTAGDLRHDDLPIDLALASVDALNHLRGDQASELAMFVARGGGLLVTGDGAKYLAPEYLPRDVRNLLPVILQKEGRKPPAEDPKVEEQPIKAEIAKVSMCFVLDRSYSMNDFIGRSELTRWQVASKGVTESLKLVDSGGRRGATDRSSEAYATRIGVMAFNLEQHWVFKMDAALPFARNQIGIDLDRIGDELTQVDVRKDFDKQGYNTDIYAAMKNAIEVMKEEKSAVKVIVMLTDGADRDENTKAGLEHANLRKLALANDINIVTVGIGGDFDESPRGRAARKVVEELATRTEFTNIAVDEASATKADVIFVDSVETAFQAYDDKKKKEEEERKRKLDENKEEPKVDVMPGTFPLVLGPAGEQLFGRDALPDPGPKVGWLARNFAKEGAAVALAAETTDGVVPAMAFLGYGLGRVGFWGAGTDPEALGELTGWLEFPGLFAGSMRWLQPREEPDVRLLAEATPDGVRILDPLEHAEYVLKTGENEISLKLKDGMLTAGQPLPLGPGEIIERVATDEETLERGIGDIFVATTPPSAAKQTAVDAPPELPPLTARSPEVTTLTREATLPMLYLLLVALLVMPIERLVRRRS